MCVKIGRIYRTHKGSKYFDAVWVQSGKENYQKAEENYMLSSSPACVCVCDQM